MHFEIAFTMKDIFDSSLANWSWNFLNICVANDTLKEHSTFF